MLNEPAPSNFKDSADDFSSEYSKYSDVAFEDTSNNEEELGK